MKPYTRNREGFAQHLSRLLRQALRDLAIALLVALVLGAGLAEVLGAYLTGAFPDETVHFLALATALVFGYAAVMTMALITLIRGLAGSTEWVVGQVEQLASRVIHEAGSIVHVPEQHAAQPKLPALPHPDGSGFTNGIIGGIKE